MKIVYSGIRNENYDRNRPSSFEHSNFYSTLKQISGLEVAEYPFDPIVNIGKRKWNEELLRLVKDKGPDLFFAFMFSDEFDISTLQQIRQLTTSVAWFADDHWRLWNYSRHWAPHFSWVVTTWSRASEIYAQYGIKNVIRSQWAANTNIWKPIQQVQGKPLGKDIDVSFIGQRMAKREKVVTALRAAGISVYARGLGWPEGRASHEDMLRIVARSKICLNLSDAPDRFSARSLGRLFSERSRDKIVPSFRTWDNFKTWRHLNIPQIKARPFELAACGAFVISGYADDIENYYKEGEEMVFYRSAKELVEKVKYYLERPEERERIARAGYERTTREHTYEKRFRELFEKIGLNL